MSVLDRHVARGADWLSALDGTSSPRATDDTPVAISSRGPNGTHWPPNTPDPWATATTTIADFTELQAALDVASSGDVIAVSDGSTTGSDITLTGGSTGWATNVLVRAASLQGHNIGVRIVCNADHVTFSGFDADGGDIRLSQCERSFIARQMLRGSRQWTHDGSIDSGMYECVAPDYGVGGGDRIQVKATLAPSSGFVISGSYLKGIWLEDGDPGHCDTLQTLTQSQPDIDITVIDTALFCSSDKMMQNEDGQIVSMSFINSWANSPNNRTEEPPSGAGTPGFNNVFSGVGDNFLFEDSDIIGFVNHKGSTSNTGLFRRSNVQGGTATTLNSPTMEDTVVSEESVTLAAFPPPTLPDLTTIWGP